MDAYNTYFQSDNSKLHILKEETDHLLAYFIRFSSENNLNEARNIETNNINENKRQMLTKFLEFNLNIYNFEVDISQISDQFINFLFDSMKQLVTSIKTRLPFNDKIFESFEILNPKKRGTLNGLINFREVLLKSFMNFYDPQNLNKLKEEFDLYLIMKDEEFPLKFSNYITNRKFDLENFFIDILKSQENPFPILSEFFINFMVIPNSTCFVERLFSQVTHIKNEYRASLEVDTVSKLLKIKSFYGDSMENFQPEERHFIIYEQKIKD